MNDDSEKPDATPEIVTIAKIEEIMTDEGYSADSRKTWLKTALTAAAKAYEGRPTEAAKAVVAELEARLGERDSGVDRPRRTQQTPTDARCRNG